MLNGKLARIVEHICNRGCVEVTRDIEILERGEIPLEVVGLTLEERHLILYELRSIMEVYGDTCMLPQGDRKED